MELVDSHLDITDSCLDSSHFSDSTHLLQSRLSAKDMEQMERDNLLIKLLELYQALDSTEKQNQLLRIEKAQLRTQLKTTKTKAKQFIHNNIAAAQSIIAAQSDNQPKLSSQNSQNCFMTPYDSVADLDNIETGNKVFVKSHKRGASNNCVITSRDSTFDPRSYCQTLLNSPSKQESIRFESSKQSVKEKSAGKLVFPKSKLNALVAMQREYEDANQDDENRTLENFESFYCHKKDDFGETQRWVNSQNNYTKPKSLVKNNYPEQKITYTEQSHNYINQNGFSSHKVYQPFERNQPHLFEEYEEQESDRGTQRGMNKSMSSSGLSNKNYCNSRGFKIPTSIDEIWGSSKLNNGSNNHGNSNKPSKLTKVNMNKSGVQGLQRKTYLNF